MPFDWIKFWNVGEHLRVFSKKEEYQRSAVGRYYYACFLLCRDYYENVLDEELDKSEAHQNLIDFFKDSDNHIENEISRHLKILRFIRNKADYSREFYFYNVRRSRKKSKIIFSLLKKLNKG